MIDKIIRCKRSLIKNIYDKCKNLSQIKHSRYKNVYFFYPEPVI
ncbi:MAG: transposase [cyanobacterium endosymbiont of Rhopalodia musculus]